MTNWYMDPETYADEYEEMEELLAELASVEIV